MRGINFPLFLLIKNLKMLNLNKKLVTKEDLLKHVSPLNIFNFYSNKQLQIRNLTLSPLRKEKNPSFSLFVKNGEILFKDFVLGGGDCIKFVQMMFSLNYMDALSKIVIDFNLKSHFLYKEINNVTKNKNFKEVNEEKIIEEFDETYLNIRRRKWQKHDLEFWSNFGITYKTLKHYKVVPISYIFLNDTITKADKFAYAFIEKKDDKLTFKIYQPFNKKIKWLTNHDESIWQGWNQLDKTGYNLIITKSLKDIMTISSVTGINSTALQNENIIPKQHIIDDLKSRFGNIYIFYDNDFNSSTNWGRKFGKKLSKLIEIQQIEIPSKYKSKDISDFVKKYGLDKARTLINNLINGKR